MASLLDNGGGGILGGSNAWQDSGPGFPTWLAQQLKALYGQFQSAPSIPTGGQDQGGGGPLTNTARPDILAPTTNMQPPPSSQPGGPAIGPPLGLGSRQPGGFDLGTIGPGLDPGAGQQLPQTSTPAQYGPPQQQPFPNPFNSGGFADRLARGLSIMDPVAGQAYYNRQLQQAQYEALMRDPKMTPGRAIGMIQNPAVLQNYYETKSLGPIKAGPVEGQLVTQGGEMTPVMPGASDANKMIEEQAAAQERGKAYGGAQAGLANQQALFDKGLQDIDGLMKDPNLRLATGAAHLMGLDKFGPGAAAAAKVHQLAGEASIAGLSYLRGIGRLNINEFNAGTQAIARLNQAQNYNDMVSALRDLRETFALARERSGVTAGVGPTPAPQSNAQPTYTRDDLLAEARRRGLSIPGQ